MANKRSKKQIHKDVSDIVKKYLDTSKAKAIGKEAGFPAAFGTGMIAADLLLTGGILTGTIIAVSVLGSATMGSKAVSLNWSRKRDNRAGQTFKAKPLVIDTLTEMETRLRSAFSVASVLHAPAEHKAAFERLAVEVDEDLKKLSPAFNIISGGTFGFGRDKFEMVVSEEHIAPGNVKMITLSHILKEMGDAAAKKEAEKKAQDEEIRKLKERLDELESPFPATPIIKKKTPPSQEP